VSYFVDSRATQIDSIYKVYFGKRTRSFGRSLSRSTCIRHAKSERRVVQLVLHPLSLAVRGWATQVNWVAPAKLDLVHMASKNMPAGFTALDYLLLGSGWRSVMPDWPRANKTALDIRVQFHKPTGGPLGHPFCFCICTRATTVPWCPKNIGAIAALRIDSATYGPASPRPHKHLSPPREPCKVLDCTSALRTFSATPTVWLHLNPANDSRAHRDMRYGILRR
jgi:hypothetical protein